MVIAGIAILIVITLMNNGDKHAGETLTLSTSLIIKYFIAGMCASQCYVTPRYFRVIYVISIWRLWYSHATQYLKLLNLTLPVFLYYLQSDLGACWIHYFKQNYPVFPNTS